MQRWVSQGGSALCCGRKRVWSDEVTARTSLVCRFYVQYIPALCICLLITSRTRSNPPLSLLLPVAGREGQADCILDCAPTQ
jgi:hypothetical protein